MVAEGLSQGGLGPYACACQLAESSGDLLFDHPEEILTPNDFASLEEVEQRLRLYEELSNRQPRPFQWKFDREALQTLVAKLEAKRELVSSASVS